MTTRERTERLKSFFAAYFHQDWMEDAERPEEVVEQYLATAIPDEAARLAEDIRAFLESCSDEAELRDRLFRELGCYYDPTADGVAARDWLLQIVSALSGGPG